MDLTADRIPESLAPEKGGVPVSMRYRITPRDHMLDVGSFSPWICSGAA